MSALAEVCGSDKFVAITVAIDKLDKIGMEKVAQELENKRAHDRANLNHKKLPANLWQQ